MKLKHLFSILSLLVLFSFQSYANPVDDVGDSIEMIYKMQSDSNFLVAEMVNPIQNRFVSPKNLVSMSTLDSIKTETLFNSCKFFKPDRIQLHRSFLKSGNHRRTDHPK